LITAKELQDLRKALPTVNINSSGLHTGTADHPPTPIHRCTMKSHIKMAAYLSEAKGDIRADFERAWAVKRPSLPLATHHVTPKSIRLRRASLVLGLVARRSSPVQTT
jgi:hypothetical protein